MKPRKGCPKAQEETAWLSAESDGTLADTPFAGGILRTRNRNDRL